MMKSIDVTMKILFMLESFSIFWVEGYVGYHKIFVWYRVPSIELEQRHRL